MLLLVLNTPCFVLFRSHHQPPLLASKFELNLIRAKVTISLCLPVKPNQTRKRTLI